MKNFFYCHDCLAAFYSEKSAYDCPLCESPMTVSGWLSGLADSSPEEGSDSPSEGLAA